MTVLITGGTGFVGLAIVEELLRRQFSVVTYGPQTIPAAAMDYFRGLGGNVNCEIGDVCDGNALRAAMQRHQVSKLVHGAAITAGIERERNNPKPVIQVNLVGTLEVLEAAVALGVQSVVQLGTGSVYGSAVKADGLLDPATDPAVPDSLYGITKFAAERLACRYRQTRQLNVSVARLGVVFGRWEHDTGVRDTLSMAYHLVRMAQRGEHAKLAPVVPNDWVYSRDVAQAVALMLQANTLQHDIYQVATGQSWSVIDWCALLAKRYPSFTYETVQNVEDANIGRLSPSPRPPFAIDRLRSELGYIPTCDAQTVLHDYLDWLELNLLPQS